MGACHRLWAHRAMGQTGNVIAGVLLGAFATFMLYQGVPGVIPWLLLAGSGTVLVLNAGRNRLWRGYYRSTPKFAATITAHLSADGVGVTSTEAENQVPWSHFKSYALIDNILFLIVDQRQFSIIPLDVCRDIAQRAAVEELVKDNLKPLSRRLL